MDGLILFSQQGTLDRAMRSFAGIITVSTAALLVASCGGNSPAAMVQSISVGDPAAPYVGMSTEQIISCAGTPHSRYGTGTASETLTYRYSGAGPVPRPAAEGETKKKSMFGGSKKKEDKDWSCSASLAFENGRLQRVHFAHKEVRSPYDWQGEKDAKKAEALRKAPVPTCAFSLPNCRRS